MSLLDVILDVLLAVDLNAAMVVAPDEVVVPDEVVEPYAAGDVVLQHAKGEDDR